MRVNSKAWLYNEDALRRLRSEVHFAHMPYKYKSILRNMIKLLALHDIYSSDTGEFINTKRKTKAARERAEALPRRRFTSFGPPPLQPTHAELMAQLRRNRVFSDE